MPPRSLRRHEAAVIAALTACAAPNDGAPGNAVSSAAPTTWRPTTWRPTADTGAPLVDAYATPRLTFNR
ncbi:hypothetical protein ACWDSL_24045 [Streptomyces sp. NPDC000941]